MRDNYASNVEQFLNRIMVLHVGQQNRIFVLFYERYQRAVESAKQQSAFDFGVEEIRARNLKRIAEPETLFVDATSGARTTLHELEGEVDVVRNTFGSAAQAAEHGFYRNVRSERIYAVAPHWDPDQNSLLLTAVKGSRRSLEPQELHQKYVPVPKEEARRWWEVEYAKTPATEPRRYYLLSGALFPIYDKVMGSTGVKCVKIARARLVDGQSLVGLSLSAANVPQVKQRLGIGTPLGDATAAEILELVVSGSMIELDNGWRLATSRIAGDEVLELKLSGVPAKRDELVGYGLLEEIVQYKRRWFVVLENAQPMLSLLLKQRKPVRDLTADDSWSV